MTPSRFEGADRILTAEGCLDLPVKMIAGTAWSLWTPSAEELAALNAGAAVMLGVQIGAGQHPPVFVQVQDAPPADA